MARRPARKSVLRDPQHALDLLSEVRLVHRAIAARSLTTTARSLGVSVSTVTRAVQRAERWLGVAIFIRGTRGVVLTEAGTAYGAHLTRWLAEDEAVRGQLAEVRLAKRGTLRISVPVFIAEHVLPEVLAVMRLENPDVLMDVHASDDFVDLVNEGFDLALRMGPLPDSALQARKLVSLRLALCASPTLVARLGTPTHPSALASLPCLYYGSGPRAPAWKFVHSSGESARVNVDCVFRSNNLSLLETMAIAGLGFVRLPEWTATEALRSGRLVRVLDHWSEVASRSAPTMYAVHPRDEGKAALRAAFVTVLERIVKP